MVNRHNYLLIREYLAYMQETRRRSQETTERYWFWLRHLLLWADDTLLVKAHTIIPSFGKHIDDIKPSLAIESQRKIIETVRAFFRWAKLTHDREFVSLPAYWINDLTPPPAVQGNVPVTYVSYEEALKLAAVPVEESNIALRRDRAAAAMLFCSGARAHAFTTLPIQAVHLDEEYPFINQWPEMGVHTKNRKHATTYLFPISELLGIIREWDSFVRDQCSPTTPWYAPVDQHWGDQRLSEKPVGENRNHSLMRRLHVLYQAANLPYQSPHKFRHGFATYGLVHCQTMAEYQALSRNLMHSTIAITDKIYAHLEEDERARLLAGLVENPVSQPDDELLQFFRNLSREDLRRATLIAVEMLGR